MTLAAPTFKADKSMSTKRFASLAVLLCTLFAAYMPGVAVADEYRKTLTLYQSFPEAKPYFENAHGYAVFPTVGKGGVGVGGAFGKGQVYADGKLTGTSSLAQLSVGFQLGGQAYSQMIFFEDERAYREFTSGRFAFGADASVAVITAGAQAQASTSGSSASAAAGPRTGAQLASRYVNGMAVLVHVRGGLMYEASVSGQKFSFEPLK